MTSRKAITMLGACLLTSGCLSAAQAQSTSTAVPTTGAKPVVNSSGSMCANPDQVVFSCPLANGKKKVSICAAGDVRHGAGRFYYAYGHVGAPDLVYPAQGQNVADPFARTHLLYGGATGGQAYSFVNAQYKYIVYAISGTGTDSGGVIVQRTADGHVLADMKCQQGKVTQTDDDSLIDATLKWKSDSDIHAHGLPRAH